jgi:hypothetical protein
VQPIIGRPTAAIVVVALLVGAALYIFHSLRSLPGDAIDKSFEVVSRLRSVAEAFHTATLETTFANYSTSISGSKHLQFSTLRQVEVYTRRDAGSLFWGELELPEVVVSATAPVEYTYYLDFDEEWRFKLDDRTLLVEAPEIKFNTPAIDISRIEFQVEESSVFRDEDGAILRLKEQLTSMSKRRAAEQIDLVREAGRNEIREFVEEWIVGGFSDGARYRVRVRFADELDPGIQLTEAN